MKTLTIGLFGFGVVGEGIYRVLLEKPELGTRIKRICIKHPEKPRDAPSDLFTTRADEILGDPEIDVVVELINDAEAAFSICRTAMERGKAVVSANKRMIAENLRELVEMQERHNLSFLYEAAVCGSVPIIRNLEEYFDNDMLHSVSGIVNGSTNFILSQMSLNGHSFDEVLRKAQELGFAESDPALDVEGMDAAYKLTIILLHAFGVIVDPRDLVRKGITALHPFDMQYAREKGKTLKLLASTRRTNGSQLSASVLPAFVDRSSKFSGVDNEYNGVLIGSSLSDEQFLSGKGAGRYPTSSAVLSDISALRYGYKYEYKKRVSGIKLSIDDDIAVTAYVSYAPGKVIDNSMFDQVIESFSGVERCYVIGQTSSKRLQGAAWWEDSDVSVVLN